MSRYHESPVRVDCPNVRVAKEGDKALAQSSVERILKLAEGKSVFSGHEAIRG